MLPLVFSPPSGNGGVFGNMFGDGSLFFFGDGPLLTFGLDLRIKCCWRFMLLVSSFNLFVLYVLFSCLLCLYSCSPFSFHPASLLLFSMFSTVRFLYNNLCFTMRLLNHCVSLCCILCLLSSCLSVCSCSCNSCQACRLAISIFCAALISACLTA